jgi:hypothetical protein
LGKSDIAKHRTSYQAASSEKEYVTFSVSPLSTVLSPPVKSPAENKMPDVPLFTLASNAPATTVPFTNIANELGLAELEITDGSAVVAVPNVTALRLPV